MFDQIVNDIYILKILENHKNKIKKKNFRFCFIRQQKENTVSIRYRISLCVCVYIYIYEDFARVILIFSLHTNNRPSYMQIFSLYYPGYVCLYIPLYILTLKPKKNAKPI